MWSNLALRRACLSALARSQAAPCSKSPALRPLGLVPSRLMAGAAPKGTPASHEEQSKWVKEHVKDEWIGFGMAPHNRKQDWWEGHLYIACIVWIMIVPLWIRYYAPDKNLEDWAHREAYIVLREREAKGLEPISRDLIPAEEVVLPDDEELGDAPVMI